jgi:hypothetical protein
MKKIYFLSVMFLVLSCTGTTRNTLQFTKQDYPGEWPFAVDEMEVYCSGYSEIYGKASNGKVYALNGSAKGVSHDPSVSKIKNFDTKTEALDYAKEYIIDVINLNP